MSCSFWWGGRSILTLLTADQPQGVSTAFEHTAALSENIKPGRNDGLAIVAAYRVSEKGLEKTWATPPLAPIIDTVGLAIHGKHADVSTTADTFCLSLEKGEKLASVKDVGGARTQTALVADGRPFLLPDTSPLCPGKQAAAP